MADYYPLIARAVAGLDKNTGEARRTLYERARTALVSQLRAQTPPLSEGDITKERLALEEAIRKVEGEAARRPRTEPPKPAEPPAAPPPPPPERPSRERGSISEAGLKEFREVVGETEDLEEVLPKPARETTPPIGAPTDIAGETSPRPSQAAPSLAGATTGTPSTAHEPEAPGGTETPPPSRPQVIRSTNGEEEGEAKSPQSRKGLIAAAITIIVLVGIGLLSYWQRDRVATLFNAVRGQPTVAQRDTSPSRPKIPDRLAQPSQQETPAAPQKPSASPPAQQPAAVAQRVVLFEEDPADPQGKRFVGSAIWRTETVPGGANQPPEVAVRADVEIPERRMTMTMSFRRNTDKQLPASHTIEIMFNLPADFPFGGVNNIPIVLMKQTEQTRGAPLAGLVVKVTSGFFLVGLSSAETEVQRNIQYLKERAWFDIPLVYNNGRRAIMVVEKGVPGDNAFKEAFTAWKQ